MQSISSEGPRAKDVPKYIVKVIIDTKDIYKNNKSINDDNNNNKNTDDNSNSNNQNNRDGDSKSVSNNDSIISYSAGAYAGVCVALPTLL